MKIRSTYNFIFVAGACVVLLVTAVQSQTTRPFARMPKPSNFGNPRPHASGDPIDLAAAADDSPFTIPAVTLPDRLLASKPLGNEFELLTRRSIFRKGSQSIASSGSTGFAPVPTTAPVIESTFIFNGVARANDRLVAFFEDSNSHAVALRHDNEPLARGKILHITLDGLDYVANGKTTHLTIGQDLSGEDQGSSLASQPTGALSNDNGPSPAGESVLDRLRRRRRQELSH